MKTLRSQFYAALEGIGAYRLHFDTCCQLLAVYYVYGSSNELFVLNSELREDAEMAARRFHIGGGEQPDADAVAAIQGYAAELEADLAASRVGEDPSAPASRVCHVGWAIDLMRGYGFNKLIV